MLNVSDAFAQFPVLETARLILRRPVASDAPAMFRIMSDPAVIKYVGGAAMQAPDEALQRIAGMADDFQAQVGVRWAIADRATGQFLGSAGFWRLVKPHFRAETGYELSPERWGQGVMPEALGAILTFGFETIGLHTVEANIDPENTGSRRVLEKLGFVREGYLRESFYEPEQARFTDTALYSLLASDWASRSAQG